MARQSRLPPFLLTRPAEQSARFAADLRQRFGAGLRILVSPLMAPVFLQPDLPSGPFAALIFTSETGVEGFRRIAQDAALRGLTLAWCVGGRTAAAAQDAGLQTVAAEGDARSLIATILAARPATPLLHLRGRHAAADVAGALTAAGIEAAQAIVYDQRPQALSAEAEALLTGSEPVIAPLFSPRTARMFAAQAQRLGATAPLWVACLSPAVSEALGNLAVARRVVAARPDAQAMSDALDALIAAGHYA